MKILVTGGAGYIGSHTCVELMNSGHEAVIIDNFCNSCSESVKRIEEICGKKVYLYEGDVRDSALLDKIFTEHKIDSVIHFAGLKAVGESCEKPVVSVVLASYNHAEYIGEAIESVLNQTYPNFELIIADDASTDGSQEVIQRYQDSRIRYISAERNTGFGAPEKGFKSVRGKYIVGFTSDDRLLPELLETSVNYMEKNKTCGACFSRPEIVGSSGKHMESLQMEAIFETENRTKEEWFYRLYCGGNCFLAPGACVRSDWFWDLGVFRYEYRQLQDYECWLRLVQKTEVYLHEKKLVQYRIHQDGKNANISSPTREVCQRDYTERLYILLEIMEHLEENFFLKTFYRELIWLPGTEGYCLECEKFCVMTRAAAVPQEAAVFYYFRHCREEKFRYYLETYYGVFRRDIWKLSGDSARIEPT